MTPITPCATWTDDCQGKQDYDGRLLGISTRYWPGRYQTNGWPSAKASIVLHHGEPDSDGHGATTPWRVAEFEAPTEAEVKAQVEAWVWERFNEVCQILKISPSS